jgi:serine/threonine-protein kinase
MWAAPPNYELVKEIGRGAIGTVYLARQPGLGQEVAIKRVSGGAASHDPETVRRFARETRLIAGLDHPAIVRVLELSREGADLLVVMEHVVGTDLRRVLAAGAPTPERAVGYLVRIAAALDHAHRRGVLHRDLKPSNVLVADGGQVKVGDFGLTALLERRARFATRPGTPPSTPAYMAPELARGDLSVDCRVDVYSLGVIAYEMLVGRVPFPIDPEDVYATVRAQMERQPPSPGDLVPGFPPLLEAALLWALQKQPERRPATAGELAAALQDALRRSPAVPALHSGGRAADAAARPPNGRREAAASSPARRRGRLRGAILAAACLLTGAGLAVAASRVLLPAPSPPPLLVTSVTAAAEPAGQDRTCPVAAARLSGVVDTDGPGGSVTYQWLRPDGGAAPPQQVTVQAGHRRTTVTLTVSAGGAGAAGGVAALHVLSPASVYSQPVRVSFAC